jgi:hypothetical protein
MQSGDAGDRRARLAELLRRRLSAPQPLSFAEERLWLLEQLAPGDPTYNYAMAGHLRGPLDTAALGRALDDIWRRHEALRSRFECVEGRPVKRIGPADPLPLPVIAVDGVPEAERPAVIERLAQDEAARPFDLARGPLFRARLLRFNADEHLLLVTAHHIVFDGWSLTVFLRETVLLYEAALAGTPPPLVALPIQYVDFARWQKEQCARTVDAELAYWTETLRGMASLRLPLDRPRPPVQAHDGARLTRVVGPEILTGLKRLGDGAGATLFMTVVAAFQALLAHLCRQDDVVVGTDVANRVRPEVEGLIGFFVNQLVLRTDLSGDPSFRELVERVRLVCLGAYAHQDVPFERLVHAVASERDPSRTPLFQVKIALLPRLPQVEIAGLTVRLLEVGNGTSKFDLLLNLSETADGLVAMFEYDTSLFKAATVAAIASAYECVLAAAAENGDLALSALGARLDAHRRQVDAERLAAQPQALRQARRRAVASGAVVGS